MKYLLAFGLSFLTGYLSISKAPDLMEIRKAFYEATLDSEKAIPLLHRLNKIDDPNPTITAYKAASEAIMVKTLWNPFEKISKLKNSRKHLENAVQAAPDNVEVRFIRFAVQSHIPSILGLSKDMDEDKNFIMANLIHFNLQELSSDVQKYIVKFMITSGKCSDKEIEHLREKVNL